MDTVFAKAAKDLKRSAARLRLNFEMMRMGVKPEEAAKLNAFFTTKDKLKFVIANERSDACNLFGTMLYSIAGAPQCWSQFGELIGVARNVTGMVLTQEQFSEVDRKSIARIHDACDGFLQVSENLDPRLFTLLDRIPGKAIAGMDFLEMLPHGTRLQALDARKTVPEAGL